MMVLKTIYLSPYLLEKYQVPAVIYITTSWSTVNGMSWTDRLEYCLEKSAQNTLNIKLPWRDSVASFTSTAEKIELMNEIRYQVKRSENLIVDDFVNDFFMQCEQDCVQYSDDPLDLKLNWNQIEDLEQHPLITIGGHTHTHRIMSFLSEEECENEINTCLKLLRENSKVNTKHFSYPEGLAYTYNDQVIQKLQNHGITCSPSAMDGVNSLNESLFHLKRVMVG